MTMIVSCATKGFISMTVDSALTIEEGATTRFGFARKAVTFPGTGIVGSWGQWDGNRIARYWSHIPPEVSDVDELLGQVGEYILEVEHDQDESPTDEFGYHIAGFDSKGQARLHHYCWAIPRPTAGRTRLVPQFNDHSPTGNKLVSIVYNGRHDIADVVIRTLIAEINQGKPVRFGLSSPADLVRLGDFIARVAAELTPEVGAPFTTFLFAPGNRSDSITNRTCRPLGKARIEGAIRRLFRRVPQEVDYHSESDEVVFKIVVPGPETGSETTGYATDPPRLEFPAGTAAIVPYKAKSGPITQAGG